MTVVCAILSLVGLSAAMILVGKHTCYILYKAVMLNLYFYRFIQFQCMFEWGSPHLSDGGRYADDS